MRLKPWWWWQLGQNEAGVLEEEVEEGVERQEGVGPAGAAHGRLVSGKALAAAHLGR